MPHVIRALDDRTVELHYSGVVGYLERAQAVDDVAQALKAGHADRLLSDFTQATTIEEDRAVRADFIAHMITHLDIRGARVAFVGLGMEHGWPAELACEIRHIPARRFDSREEALAWLAAEEIDPVAPVLR